MFDPPSDQRIHQSSTVEFNYHSLMCFFSNRYHNNIVGKKMNPDLLVHEKSSKAD